MRKVVVSVLLLWGVFTGIFCQNRADYRKMTAEDILDIGWKSPSAIEKQITRRYLAENFPESKEGMFAAGWIAFKNENKDLSNKIYNKCSKLFPNFINLLYNGGNAKTLEDYDAKYKKLLALDPSFMNYVVVDYQYNNLLKLYGQESADRFLEEYETKLGKDLYIYDYIKGKQFETIDKDYKKALELYSKAISKKGGDVSFDLWKRLYNIKLEKLFDHTIMDNNHKYSIISALIQSIVPDEDADNVTLEKRIFCNKILNYLGDYAKNSLQNQTYAYSVYMLAFNCYPTAETITKMVDIDYSIGTIDRGVSLLIQADEILPQNSMVLRDLALIYRYSGKIQKAEEYYLKAIKHANTDKFKFELTYSYCTDVLETEYLNYEKSYQLMKEFLDSDYGNKTRIYSEIVDNRVLARDYNTALEYIELSLSDANDAYRKSLLNRKKTVEMCLIKENDIKDYYLKYPFEKDWEKKYGDSINLSINFALNSDTIPVSDYESLDKLAKILTEGGAEDYSFKISGHTDSTGSDPINLTLSYNRAKSVADYFYHNHNINYLQIDYQGYGSKIPISTNETDEGRAKNRRVEINIAENLSKYRISATTTFDASWLMPIPNSKKFVSGDDPVQIWDYEKMIKVRDLDEKLDRRYISPNGRYLAAIKDYGSYQQILVIIDLNKNHIVVHEPVGGDNLRLAWSPYSDEIVCLTKRGYISKYNLKLKKITAITQVPKHHGLGLLAWTKNSQYIAIAQKQANGEIIILNADDLTYDRSLSEVDWPHSIGTSGDGRYLISTDNQRMLHLWDISDWSHKYTEIPVLSSRIEAHPTKDEIILNDWGGGENNHIIVVDIKEMRLLNYRDFGDHCEAFYVNNGEDILVKQLSKHTVSLIDAQTLETKEDFNGLAAFGVHCFKDTANNQVIAYDQESINVWDIMHGKKIHLWNDKVTSLIQTPGDESKYLGFIEDAAMQKTHVYIYDSEKYTKKKAISLDYVVNAIDVNNDVLLVAGTPFMPKDKGSSKGKIHIYDLNNFSLKNSLDIHLPTDPLYYDFLGPTGFYSVDLNPSNTKVLFTTYWTDGWKTIRKFSKNVRIYDLHTGKLEKKIATSKKEHNCNYISEDEIAIDNFVYSTETGEYLRKINENNYINLRKSTTEPNTIVFEEKNLKIEYTKTNELKFFDLKNNKLVLTIVTKRDNEWLAYTPAGVYTSSLNGTDKVFWLLGSNLLPLNSLKSKFENPYLIKSKLENIYSGKIIENKLEPKIENDVFKIPYSVEIISENNIETRDNKYALKLRVMKQNETLPKLETEFLLNGRPINNERGIKLREKEAKTKDYVITQDFDLYEGVNVIQASFIYKGARLFPQTIVITHVDDESIYDETNTHLWYFGIGISEYQNHEQNLDYAHKDAIEIGKLLERQEGVLYKKVHTKILIDEEATEKNIRIQMHEFLKKAGDGDLVLIFLAGHGTVDNDQSLYYMTYDSDLSKPYTGMDLTKFETFLKARPINQKAVFFLDICHAGAMGLQGKTRGGVTSEEAIKQLSEGTGTTVFVSSTGRESSYENIKYSGGHGAFTSALLEGLKGYADSESGDNNSFVNIFELISYVSHKVPEITDNNQHPTTPKLFNVRDFPISKSFSD